MSTAIAVPAEAWPLDRPASRQVQVGMICSGDIIRLDGGRAAEVQAAARDGGENALVRLPYLECRSGHGGTVCARSDVLVTLLRSSGMRVA
jgi:hypothetical protein